MTTYNTGNPIGSTEVKDLYDNAENLDIAINSQTAGEWTDRLGNARQTWKGIEDKVAASAGVYDTKAQADAAIGTMANGDIIEVSQDETRAGARTRYKVQAGALVFVVNLDQVRIDLAASSGASLVGSAHGTVADIIGRITGVPYVGTATDGVTDGRGVQIRRTANYVGGAPGFVNAALRIDHTVGAQASAFEWGIISVMDNFATGGENVGVYGQGIRHGAATGGTFGGVFEVLDNTGEGNPTKGMVGLEVDCRGNGLDNNFNRVGIDVVVNRQLPAGAPNVVSYGIRIQNGGDAGAVVKTAFSVNATAEVGFDTSAATIIQAAIKLKDGQAIAFNETATKQLKSDGVGLVFLNGGVQAVGLNNDGSIALNAARFVVTGAWATGAQTPTLGANKPGTAGGAPAVWASVKIDGGQYWMPLWSNV